MNIVGLDSTDQAAPIRTSPEPVGLESPILALIAECDNAARHEAPGLR
jgi:hypothetical protein